MMVEQRLPIGGPNSCGVFLAMFPLRSYNSTYITLDDRLPIIPLMMVTAFPVMQATLCKITFKN